MITLPDTHTHNKHKKVMWTWAPELSEVSDHDQETQIVIESTHLKVKSFASKTLHILGFWVMFVAAETFL